MRESEMEKLMVWVEGRRETVEGMRNRGMTK